MSYSLEWKEDGEQLVGLTILAGSQQVGGANPHSSSGSKSTTPTVDQTMSQGGGNRSNQKSGMPVGQGIDATAIATVDRDLETQAERREQEVRMEEERALRKAEMEVRREQEVIAHAARMKAEVVRSEAQMAEYVESQGLSAGP